MPLSPGIRSFPFTAKHIVKFRRELKRVGGFNTLMVKKLALEIKDGIPKVSSYGDKETYKMKFLIGAYATLRPYYDTDMPYIFWDELYLLTQKVRVPQL